MPTQVTRHPIFVYTGAHAAAFNLALDRVKPGTFVNGALARPAAHIEPHVKPHDTALILDNSLLFGSRCFMF